MYYANTKSTSGGHHVDQRDSASFHLTFQQAVDDGDGNCDGDRKEDQANKGDALGLVDSFLSNCRKGGQQLRPGSQVIRGVLGNMFLLFLTLAMVT